MSAKAAAFVTAIGLHGFRNVQIRCRKQYSGNFSQPRACASSSPPSPTAQSASSTLSSNPVASNAVQQKKRVLSGVQPTGSLHLGNYLGALCQWTQNQDAYENFFFVVDMHAITVPHDRKALSESTLQAIAMYIACGIDPQKSTLFVQSHVRAHAELTWLLNCCTPIGWLERMIQFKEKARKQGGDGSNASVGLFDYPVLMSADVLLYQTDFVPVGEDQRQHIELARNIARRYNDIYCKKKRPRTFREPKALLQDTGARIMSLDDGASKMSKSAENDFSRINLTDPPAVLAKKIKRCKTDSEIGLEFDNPTRPECDNLLTIYQMLSGKSKEEVTNDCADMTWGRFKPLLTDLLVSHLEPVQVRYHELLEDTAFLNSTLRNGYERASEEAEKTLEAVKSDLGLLLPSAIGLS